MAAFSGVSRLRRFSAARAASCDKFSANRRAGYGGTTVECSELADAVVVNPDRFISHVTWWTTPDRATGTTPGASAVRAAPVWYVAATAATCTARLFCAYRSTCVDQSRDAKIAAVKARAGVGQSEAGVAQSGYETLKAREATAAGQAQTFGSATPTDLAGAHNAIVALRTRGFQS